MSFTSLPFLVLVGLSVAVYYLLPQRVQWMVLLAASMVFYCVGGGRTVLYVFYTAATVYVAGRLLGHYNDLRRAAPAQRWLVRTPRPPEEPRCDGALGQFGMLKWLDPELDRSWDWSSSAYLGLAFD